jgi:peptide deformylase
MELVKKELVENAVCTEVTEEEAPELIKTGEEMIKFCVSKGGVGLSASQIGINKKMFIWLIRENGSLNDFQIVFNPKYIKDGKEVRMIEGCLTYGEEHFLVNRYKYIRAIYYTFFQGKFKKVTVALSGMRSIVFQHETDHTNGITIAMKGETLSESQNNDFNEKFLRRKKQENANSSIDDGANPVSGAKNSRTAKKKVTGSAGVEFSPNQ